MNEPTTVTEPFGNITPEARAILLAFQIGAGHQAATATPVTSKAEEHRTGRDILAAELNKVLNEHSPATSRFGDITARVHQVAKEAKGWRVPEQGQTVKVIKPHPDYCPALDPATAAKPGDFIRVGFLVSLSREKAPGEWESYFAVQYKTNADVYSSLPLDCTEPGEPD